MTSIFGMLDYFMRGIVWSIFSISSCIFSSLITTFFFFFLVASFPSLRVPWTHGLDGTNRPSHSPLPRWMPSTFDGFVVEGFVFGRMGGKGG